MSKKTGKPSGKNVVLKRELKGRQVVESTPAVAANEEAAPAPTPAPADTKVIKIVKTDVKYEGARLAWYEALRAHEGKDPEAFVASCQKTPPAVPKSGKAEDPRGWLRFFVRTGVAQVEG